MKFNKIWFISILLALAFHTSAITYSVIDFPDTLICDLDSVIIFEINNNSNKSIQIKENINPIEIAILDSTANLINITRYNMNKELIFYEIQPNKSKMVSVNISGYYYEDSTICLCDVKKTDNSAKIFNKILKDISKYVDTTVPVADMTFYKMSCNEISNNFDCNGNPITRWYRMENTRKVTIKKYLPTGTYKYKFYINIAEVNNKKAYHLVNKDIFIKCPPKKE